MTILSFDTMQSSFMLLVNNKVTSIVVHIGVGYQWTVKGRRCFTYFERRTPTLWHGDFHPVKNVEDKLDWKSNAFLNFRFLNIVNKIYQCAIWYWKNINGQSISEKKHHWKLVNFRDIDQIFAHHVGWS